MNASIRKQRSLPEVFPQDGSQDELWDMYRGTNNIQGRRHQEDMSGSQTDEYSSSEETSVVFPPTYMVIQFTKHIRPEALKWLVQKICGKRRDGGAELLVRRQPPREAEGLILHVSASKIKFLEVAEEVELKKKDRGGLIREFTVSQLDDFLEDGMHVDDLLTTADRQYIVRHELENIRALAEDRHVPGYTGLRLYEGQSIVQVSLHWGLLERMYPLHDLEALDKLGKQWYSTFFGKQPYEDIRLYFGEAVALYFIFLGHYTTALLVPMVLGFLQLVLSTESLAFFCVFNVLWVTVFLEVWKRKCSELAFSWGTIGMTSLDEPRPNYHGHMGVDPISRRIQPHFPRWKTNARMYCVSLPIVLLCLACAFVVMLTSFWAEEYLIRLQKEQQLDSTGLLVMLPSILYSAIVYIMNLYYRELATFLTEWENHQTQSQFDRHRVTKLVLFEFANNFMSLFYIAFYIQDMEMLKYQLTIMLIIFQAINNFQEAILPLVIRHYGAPVLRTLKGIKDEDSAFSGKNKNSHEHCFDIEEIDSIPELEYDDERIVCARVEGEMDNYEGTYDDYLEMFIQFGYVFLFSSVFPMAAFWAVVNNVLEIRADAFKLCRLYQRPVAKRVKDIGAWQRAFEAVGAMSVMTNCGLMCLSPQLRSLGPGLSDVKWVLVFVCLEHMLLTARYLLHIAIPDRPEWVRVALARINHQSKQALKHERTLKSRRHLLRRYNTVHGSHEHHK